MLILTRRKGESIIIDGNIEVTIVESEDGRVKLGIDAPKNIEILRSELLVEVEKANKSAISKKKDLGEMKKVFKNK